jgi:biotin carboxylase
LPGIKVEAAEHATNKECMRERFKEKSVPHPHFFCTSSLEEAFSMCRKLRYPVVIKPVDNMGARGVRRIEKEDELEDAFYKALSFSSKGRVIIEEYMAGYELSIDALVWDGHVHLLTVADRFIKHPPYFVEVGHIIPSAVQKNILDEAFNVMKMGIWALGIDWGAAKADIKLTKEGPKIGELAARLSGGFHSQFTAPLATGMDYTKAVIALSVGEGLKEEYIIPKKNHAAAECAIIAKPGRIVKIEGVDEAEKIKGVAHILFTKKVGEYAEEQTDNMRKVGHVITTARTRDEALFCCHLALETIKVHTA